MKALTISVAVLATLAFAFQDEAKIQDAIRGLGSEDFEVREKAAEDLRKVGTPALEALKKAAEKSDDPEVRVRARKLVQEIEKPAKSRDRSRLYGLKGSRLSIRLSNGDTIYQFQPEEGDAIEFQRSPDGPVKLVYPDGKGGKAEAKAESLEKFLADHKDLAAKYGITKDGIDYGGSRLSFNQKVWTLPAVPRLDVPGVVPMPPFPDTDEFRALREDLRKAFEELQRARGVTPELWGGFPGFEAVGRGVQLSQVPAVLRSQLAIPEGQGVVVESVREGSAAAAAGIQRHDVLLEIDGHKIAGPADVRAFLKRESTVQVLRGGKEQTLKPEPGRKKEF